MELKDFLDLSFPMTGKEWCAKSYGNYSSALQAKLERGESTCTLDSPYKLLIDRAGQKTDFLQNNGLMCFINDRVVNVFEKEKFTGWRVFHAQLYDENKKEYPERYWGLAVTGRAGHSLAKLESTKSPAIYGLRPRGSFRFDLKRWDGSDFFMLDDMGFIIITPRVAKALRDNGITGWKANSILNLYGDPTYDDEE